MFCFLFYIKLKTTNMSEVYYVTKEGLEKMKRELEQMVKVERKSITQQIAEARDKGDLSENAEYDAAKEAQGMLEMKISILQEKILNARILDEANIGTDVVSIMNKVKLKNLKNNSMITYTLVPETEADIKQGKISVKTPISKGLLGKKVGDTAQINVPSGILEFEIVDISV
ncbi:MAG: transcription elongation factor GreA [Bacteroidales bacterium]|nr:transcription elongation factor GreA [Bacteroidales bacterium]